MSMPKPVSFSALTLSMTAFVMCVPAVKGPLRLSREAKSDEMVD
jgi:hypothetical protein